MSFSLESRIKYLHVTLPLNIWTLLSHFPSDFFFFSFQQKIAEKSKSLLPTGQRSTKQVSSCVFGSKYNTKKKLFSNPSNDAEELGAPPLPTLKPVRWFSNRDVWCLWRWRITGLREKDLCKSCLIILCFSVLVGLFFHSWGEFCLLWNISKSSPTPSFPGSWACRWWNHIPRTIS